MGFNLKHLLNPFDKRNPLRPDNVAKDPLGLRATDLLSDPKKTGSSSIAGVTTDSTTGQISVWGVPITANPSDYPAHWYTNWQATQAQTKMTFPEWVANVLTNAPQMAEEVTTWRKETGDVPLEQDLLDRVMSDYVNPALEKDKANQEKFKKLLESWQPTIDSNRALVGKLATEDGSTGHSILATQELANLQAAIDTANASAAEREKSKLGDIDTSVQEYLGAIDQQKTSKSSELDKALASYLASIGEREGTKLEDINPLLQARLDAAEAQATAASLGEQTARDQITADLASQGYIGGSSFADAQIARAGIDARTAAAQALGTAKTANASDVLGVKNEASDATYDAKNAITTKRLGVGNDAADSIFKTQTDASTARLGVKNEASDALYDATNWGAAQKLSYLDADTKRRLANLETPITLANEELNLNTAVDNAGWAGLNRSLAALDWWKLANASGGGNVTAAPTTTDTTTSVAGALGPSMVNAAMTYAQANDWWKKSNSTGITVPQTDYSGVISGLGSSAGTSGSNSLLTN